MTIKLLAAALPLACLAACTTPSQVERRAAAARDWRSSVTPADAKRLREWRADFAAALAQARAAGNGPAIDMLGALLDPDAAIPGALGNGNYRCRTIKLGARSQGLPAFNAYPAFDCRVSAYGDVQYFAKLSGSQRPMGKIYRADDLRQIFLGTLVLGDEQRPMRYGSDPDRAMAGWVERVGPAKWRIVLPAPKFESLTDVIELVPAA